LIRALGGIPREMRMRLSNSDFMKKSLKIDLGKVVLDGDLTMPPLPRGLIIFAHGSGSGRKSPRNQLIAEHLNQEHFATFLLDLYGNKESEWDRQDFNLELLSSRLKEVTAKLKAFPFLAKLPVGYYGSSTGAAVALAAAAFLKKQIHAVVSRGGRTDLADDFLHLVQAPTLLLAGEKDPVILGLNKESLKLIDAPKALKIIPGASHLFEEPGALEAVARESSEWFKTHLGKSQTSATSYRNK
jgi:pimeloyl-ACP methyl ester carboxylesterase